MVFSRLLILFSKSTILEDYFRNSISVNRLDPVRARRIVVPVMGPNRLQRLSAGTTSRNRKFEDIGNIKNI